MAPQKPNRLIEIASGMGETPETLVPRIVREEGSIYGAAVKLGVSRTTIAYWLKKLGIKVETHRVATFEDPQVEAV